MRFIRGIVIGVVLVLAILEALLRLLPVESGARMEDTDTTKPFSRYIPRQDNVYSHGWLLANARHNLANDQGFINSPDFQGQGGVLVIGNSFIESLMLDYSETIQGRLDAALGGNIHAASSSGNGVADSLQLTKFYVPRLHPIALVVFVGDSDFSSLLDRPSKGHSGFVVSGGETSVVHNDYKESKFKPIIQKSALARYVYYNLKIADWFSTAVDFRRTPQTSLESGGLEMKEQMLRYYFSELRSISVVGGIRILFLMDGDREAVYAGHSSQHSTPKTEVRKLFLRLAPTYGLDVIDMQPVFEKHWAQYRERMDFLPLDGHWNPVAHQLAAEEVLKRLGVKNFPLENGKAAK